MKNAREEADYEWMKEFSQETAEHAIATAKEFVKAVENILAPRIAKQPHEL